MPFDPIPDPLAAGWTKEGDEPHIPAGTSLRLHDTTNAGFARFVADDPGAALGGEVLLTPSVILIPGFSTDGEASTGVHVTVDDGDRQARAAVLGVPGGGVHVALRLVTGYSNGFTFLTSYASFELRRLADGSAVLTVPGRTPEVVPRLALAPSSRPGRATIAFGADNQGGVVSSEWYGLGLPTLPTEKPFAAFSVERLQLRVRA